jgi:hypothetical protein
MTRTRLLSTAALLAAIAGSTQGCAVLLTGYLIGDAMQRSKAAETCRANLKTTNDARIAEHKDPFPDTCGQ